MTARERVDPLAITGHTAATPAESTLLATTSLEDLRRAILGDAADDGVDRGELFEAVEAQLRGLRADVGLDPIVRAPASELGASSPSLTASHHPPSSPAAADEVEPERSAGGNTGWLKVVVRFARHRMSSYGLLVALVAARFVR